MEHIARKLWQVFHVRFLMAMPSCYKYSSAVPAKYALQLALRSRG